jgi:hypothetical protein
MGRGLPNLPTCGPRGYAVGEVRRGAKVVPKNPTNEARQAGADKRAADLAPIVKELHAAGVTLLRAIAAALNERGISTPRGTGQWQAGTVAQLLARLSKTVEGARNVAIEFSRKIKSMLGNPFAGSMSAERPHCDD